MKGFSDMFRSPLLFSLLILVLDARLGGSHQNCRICCDDDDAPLRGGSVGRGKSGPKGEKGERGELGARELDKVMQEMNATKDIVREKMQRPRDCAEIKRGDPSAGSGVYDIYPVYGLTRVVQYRVFCDMDTDGGGWIVFQKRHDGSQEFYRGWADYQKGFGDLQGEFWLGLDPIYVLSNTEGRKELRVDLEDFEGNTAFAHYNYFSLGAGDGYVLNIGQYSGTAGDSLEHVNGLKFTTKDTDQDPHADNCAIIYHAAFWYRSCHYASLNGIYYAADQTPAPAKGVVWYHWKGYEESLKRSEMKLR